MCSCPTTSSNRLGRHFLARTTYDTLFSAPLLGDARRGQSELYEFLKQAQNVIRPVSLPNPNHNRLVHPSSILFAGRLPDRRLKSGYSPAHRMVAYRCSLPGLTGLGNIRLRRTQPSTSTNPGLTPVPKNLKREFDLAEAGCEYRAPLTPRLARANHFGNGRAMICPQCQSDSENSFGRRGRDSNPRGKF